MTRARLLSLVLLLLAATLVVAGCGGSDSKAKAKKKTDPRKGYFDSRESDALNPVIADYNTAITKFSSGSDACNAKAQRLYEQGKSEKVQAACHIAESQLVIDSIKKVHAELDSFEREYRAECDTAREEFGTFLDTYEKAWTKQRSNWDAFATGDRSHDKDVDTDTQAAAKLANQFVDTELPKLSAACYTKADIDEHAAEAERDTKDDAKADSKGADSGDAKSDDAKSDDA